MTQYELIKRVKRRKDVKNRDVDDSNEVSVVVRATLEEMRDCVISGEKLMIQDFFTMEIRDIAPRKRRNPMTGVIEDYPAAKNIRTRISNSLRNEINDRYEED